MDELDFNLYVIAEIKYKKEHSNEEDVFPVDWYSNKNYKLKTEIIAEALKKNIKIDDTELYQKEFIEGAKQN